MRYESVSKITRDRKLALYKKNHPELSLAEIGLKYGISKQRVSFILKRQNGNKDS